MRIGSTAYGVNRLIHPVRLNNRGENLTGLAHCNGAFLRDIMLFHRYLGLCAVHLEWYRRRIKDISVCGTLFDQFVISIRKRFRHHQLAGGIGVVGVDIHRRRVVDMLHDIFACICISHLESDSTGGDNFSGFDVLLDNLNQGFKGSVIDEVAVYLAVLIHEHIEGRHQFLAVPAFGLFYRIEAVREGFRFSIAVFITYKDIPFRFFGVGITAGRLEEYLEFSAFFRRFDLC